MDNDDLLNFNYPIQKQSVIDMEAKIKEHMRNLSYNFPEQREIERYSDKYIESINLENIMKTVNIELSGPELIRMHAPNNTGTNNTGLVDVIHAEVDDESIEHNENIEEESLGGGDDYNEYFNDEDELVNENNTRGDMYD